MRLVTGTQTRLLVDLTFEFDPATATVTLELDNDGTQHPADWTGPATVTGGRWTRTAQSTETFIAGPVTVAEAGTAVVLDPGRHTVEAHSTIAGTTYITPATVVDVVSDLQYVTVGELRDHLANGGGAGSRTAAELPDERLAVKLEEATEEVLGSLAANYTIAPGVTPPLIRTITVAIGAYLATLEYFGSQPVEDRDPIVLGYTRAQALLVRLAAGRMTVPGLVPVDGRSPSGDPAIYGGAPNLGLAAGLTEDTYGSYRGTMPAHMGGVTWQ